MVPFRLRVVVGVLVTFMHPALTLGQAGAVTVAVRDSSGAAIPGVTVRIVSEETATVVVEGVTDAEGVSRAGAMAAGQYRVEAVLDGFETAVRPSAVVGGAEPLTIDFTLTPSRVTESVVVTARRIEETNQEVPIPVSVVSGEMVADSGAFNVNRLKEMIPTVQFYSSNPRNSSVNIRGLGAPFGLTNDGIEPGVGLYIDGAYFARPAAATLDFIDVERVEVLRGPQGTLFGKNTTAGAINVTTRKPAFTPSADVELNYGSLGLVQAKTSLTGPLLPKVAGRISFSGTTRRGFIDNTVSGLDLNGLNNLGFRGQLLFAPSDRTAITVAADHTRQRPDGHAQVVAGVAPTLRPANRQYAQIAADLNYKAPSFIAFDRLTDADTPWRSYQDLGGASVALDRRIGAGGLTAVTGWRYWEWRPSNDRDFIGLPVTTISAAPSDQQQWSQEVRYAGPLTPTLNLVAGGFAFYQTIKPAPFHTQEQGSAAARFLLAPTPAAATPGLLDGYGQRIEFDFETLSAALFGQLEWAVDDRLRVLPGLRVNYDQKTLAYDQQVYGGLQTTDVVLIALQRSVLSPLTYHADVADTDVSGQLTAAYQLNPRVNAYGTVATGFKSVGLNLGGVPTDALGRPITSAAIVKPEDVLHFEAGIKTEPFPGVTANLTVFNTGIKDYQTQVVNDQVGVLRGYLANADKVRVRGVEFDGSARVTNRLSLYGAVAYADGRYLSFPDAPPPLEETGGPQVKDISGSVLPGISKWALSFGSEYVNPARLLGQDGELFGALEASYRSEFSSSPSVSEYLMIEGYPLLNLRVGYRWAGRWVLSFWTRNVLDHDYFELLSAQPGNSGLYVGLPGEPRTAGVTLRMGF